MKFVTIFKNWWFPHLIISVIFSIWFGRIGLIGSLFHLVIVSLVYVFVDKWIFYVFRAKPIDSKGEEFQLISNYLYRKYPHTKLKFAITKTGDGIWGPFGFGEKVIVIAEGELNSRSEEYFSSELQLALGKNENSIIKDTAIFLYRSYFFIALSLFLRKINTSLNGVVRDSLKWVLFIYAYSFFYFTKKSNFKISYILVKKALEEKNFSLFRNAVSYKG